MRSASNPRKIKVAETLVNLGSELLTSHAAIQRETTMTFQQPTMSCVFRITSRTTEPIVREFAKHVFKRHEPDIAVRVDVDSQAPPSTRSLSAAVTRLPAGF